MRGSSRTRPSRAVVAGSAAAVYAGWALAIMAPAWLIVWIAAALAGFVMGLLRPLPRGGRSPASARCSPTEP